MKTQKTAVIAILDEQDQLVGVVYFNGGKTHTFFSCERMGMDEIDAILNKQTGEKKI